MTTFRGRLTDLLGLGGDHFGKMTITPERIELTGVLDVRYAFTKDDIDEIVYQRKFLPWMWVLAFVGRDGKDSPAYFSPLDVFAPVPVAGRARPHLRAPGRRVAGAHRPAVVLDAAQEPPPRALVLPAETTIDRSRVTPRYGGAPWRNTSS